MRDPSARLRSRARLLEFLKFRVLAAQEAFFEAWRPGRQTSAHAAPSRGVPAPPLDLVAFRQWLQPLWPEAARLSDSDLRDCLEQAERLYVDPPPRRQPDTGRKSAAVQAPADASAPPNPAAADQSGRVSISNSSLPPSSSNSSRP